MLDSLSPAVGQLQQMLVQLYLYKMGNYNE